VKPDNRINEIGKTKAVVEKRENADGKHGGQNFEKPRKIIVRFDRRPDENQKQADKQKDVKFSDAIFFRHFIDKRLDFENENNLNYEITINDLQSKVLNFMPIIKIELTVIAPVERVFDLARCIDLHEERCQSTRKKRLAA